MSDEEVSAATALGTACDDAHSSPLQWGALPLLRRMELIAKRFDAPRRARRVAQASVGGGIAVPVHAPAVQLAPPPSVTGEVELAEPASPLQVVTGEPTQSQQAAQSPPPAEQTEVAVAEPVAPEPAVTEPSHSAPSAPDAVVEAAVAEAPTPVPATSASESTQLSVAEAEAAALRDVVLVMEAELFATRRALADANAEVDGLRLDLHRHAREMEQAIVTIEQDLDAEYAEALESRVQLERESLEFRKARDLRVEKQALEEQAKRALEREADAIRRDSVAAHNKRMEILRQFFDDVSERVARAARVSGVADWVPCGLWQISAVQVLVKTAADENVAARDTFRLALVAHQIRDVLRVDTAIGKADAAVLQPLVELREGGVRDELVRHALAVVPAEVFTEGVLTDAHLLSEYDRAAQKGLEQAFLPEQGGTLLHMVGKVLTKTVIRPSHGLIEGDSADAIFARVRVFIERDDLSSALAELEKLKPAVREPCADWVRAARNRLALNATLQLMQARALARLD